MPIVSKLSSMQNAAERLKRVIMLPSSGYSIRSYSVDGTITVYPWDSEVSEWMLEQSSERRGSSFSFMASVAGRVTRFSSSIIDQFVASELLLILLVARGLASNGRLHYTSRCPHCKRAQKQSEIVVPDALGVVGKKEIDYPGYEDVTLPESTDVLTVRPLKVIDVTSPSTTPTAENAMKNLSQNTKNTLRAIIAVGGGTPEDVPELVRYYLALPLTDVAFLKRRLREISPGVDMLIPHECDFADCKLKFSFDLALDYDFFL
jgi:hypothetical protein